MNRSSFMFAALVAAASPAFSATPINPAKVCIAGSDGTSQADPIKLLNATLRSGGTYSSGYFDANGDGSESLDEKLSMLFNPHRCELSDAACNAAAVNLAAAMEELTEFLQKKVRLETIRTPSPEEIAARPYLGDKTTAPLATVLDEDRRFVITICKPQPVPPIAKSAHPWRITGTIEGLSLPRSNEQELASVPQASLSYVSDRENRKRTFDVDMVAGLAFSPSERSELIPFLAYRRQDLKTRDAISGETDSKGSSEWNVGLLYSLETDSNDTFDIAALYTAETENDVRVVGIDANWKPGFLYRSERLPFGGARRMGPGWVKLNAQLNLHAGDVIKAGTSPDLVDQDAYARIGPALQLTVWPNVLPRLRADATYKHLFRIGDTRDVEWLDAGFNYDIDPDGHYTLRYSFQKGRDVETLERIRRWTLSFGVRF